MDTTAIGYIEIDNGAILYRGKEFLKRRNRARYRILRDAMKEQMSIERKSITRWFRKKRAPVKWTRKQAAAYLRDNDGVFIARWKVMTMTGWGTAAECQKLMDVAEKGTSRTILINLDLWNRILTHF
jgi:hypothetical protein